MLFSYFFSNTRKLHGPAILHVRCAVYNLKWPQYAVSSKMAVWEMLFLLRWLIAV